MPPGVHPLLALRMENRLQVEIIELSFHWPGRERTPYLIKFSRMRNHLVVEIGTTEQDDRKIFFVRDTG
jgi:hypothetical protein